MNKTPYQGHEIQVVSRGEQFRGFIDGIGKTWGRTEAEAFDACIDLLTCKTTKKTAAAATDEDQ